MYRFYYCHSSIQIAAQLLHRLTRLHGELFNIRLHGKLFNIRRLQAATKYQSCVFWSFSMPMTMPL